MAALTIQPARGAWAVVAVDPEARAASPASFPGVRFVMAGTGAGALDMAARHEADHGAAHKTRGDAVSAAMKADPHFVDKPLELQPVEAGPRDKP